MTDLADGGYVELHARSAFSFLRGASQPDDLAQACADREISAMALCDRGGFYGSARFHRAAGELGVKPLVGCELLLEDGCSLPVLVKSRQGYRNLCRLLSETNLSAAKGEGRIAWHSLSEHAEGLFALSGDEEGRLHQAWARHDKEGMLSHARQLKKVFGCENVFLEVQRHHERGEDRYISSLRDLSQSEGLQLLATNGVSYATQNGRAVQDLFTCLRKGVTFDKAGGLLSQNAQRFLKSPSEMRYLFRDLPEAVDNTLVAAERLEFTLEDLGYEFPSYDTPDGHDMDSYLSEVVWSGARKRYGEPLGKDVRRQIRHELEVIAKLGFSGYFLIVWDLMNYCRANRIMAQGRGSAANSAVCFCLEITPVDPVGGKLLFERFLNEERRSWPDIDIDLPSGERREQVIQEVYRRYSRSGAAMTANVISYRRRSAVREVGKVLGFSEEAMGRFSSLYGSHHYAEKSDIPECLEKSGIATSHPRARAMAKLTERLLGLPRHLGQHSGGMIICQGALDAVVPLEQASMPGRSVAQWDKNDCADMGIVKIDLLGLGMMAVMQDTIETLKEKGVPIDLATLPKDDAATFEMMQKADTVGVFQIESRAQIATLPRMKPKSFYDVVIEVGIIRPGPIQGKMVHPYLERREDPSKVEYIDPSLVDTLERTLGVPLFQEQILKVAMAMGGLSGAQAEELRRAVSMFNTDETRMNKVLQKLVAAMRGRKVSQKKIDQVVQAVSSFAHYGFPESHAISFGLLAYASTYLKCHHAAEFYVGLLNNQPMGFYSEATLIQDAKRHGIRIKPVCVSRSQWKSAATDPATIRLGLRMVKGLSKQHSLALVEARERKPFASLRDLRLRSSFGKGELRQLASIGALNCFASNRREALWAVESMLEDADDLFAGLEAFEPSLSPLEVMTHFERLGADYKGVGVTVGKHPMAYARSRLKQVWRASDLESTPDGGRVRVAGQVICRQKPGTAKGFVFLSLEDETGISNVIVVPKLFELKRLVITQEKFLLISGVLQNVKGVRHVKAELIEPLESADLPASVSYDFH